MRLLHYNFAKPDDAGAGAGGVGIYLKGLVDDLATRGMEVTTLGSGTSYSPYTAEVGLSVSKGGRYRTANILNSPVVAPSYKNFFAPDVYLKDERLNAIPRQLRERLGPFDILHFHGVEGLTLGFFHNLRAAFPSSVLYFSAHNYNLVCLQPNLWKDDRVNCTDYHEGKACVSCMPYRDAEYTKRVQAFYWLRSDLAKWPTPYRSYKMHKHKLAVEEWRHFEPGKTVIFRDGLSEDFRDYRQANAAMTSAVFDRVLAVSERTKTVLVNHSLDARNIRVSYIGNSRATAAPSLRRTGFTDPLHIAYFGYARRDKGFFFLMRALRALPEHVAKRIHLTVAVRVNDKDPVIGLVGRLAKTLHGVSLHNGYDARSMPALLSNVSLGIVPSLWEDNLPQVAIEYVSAGIPVLVSDLGGASEIASNAAFVFEAGSIPSFAQALEAIVSGRVRLGDFWRSEPNIRSMTTHVEELLQMYADDLSRKSAGSPVAL